MPRKPENPTLTREQMEVRRNATMAKVLAFLHDYFDSGAGSSADIHCIQHGAPDTFFCVVEFHDKDYSHERLEALTALVALHDAKLNLRDGTFEVYVGRAEVDGA